MINSLNNKDIRKIWCLYYFLSVFGKNEYLNIEYIWDCNIKQCCDISEIWGWDMWKRGGVLCEIIGETFLKINVVKIRNIIECQ